MNKPLISVIMLSYNREKFVSQTIESVLAQDLTDFEFVIVDNGSTDKSGIIIENYAKNDERIRVFRRDNSNIGAGRNLGIEKSCGEFFAFIDDDDYITTGYLSFLYTLAFENNADIAVCGSMYETGKPKYVFDDCILCNKEQAVTNFLLRRYYNSGNAAKLFRNSGEISSVRYSEKGNFDDIHTVYKFFVAVGEQPVAVAIKGEPKYIVRRHEENNSSMTADYSKLTPQWLDEYLHAYRKRTVYISEKLPNLAGLAQWSEWSFMISMVEKIERLNIKTCFKHAKLMITELKKHSDEFHNAQWSREFEKKWIERYVK